MGTGGAEAGRAGGKVAGPVVGMVAAGMGGDFLEELKVAVEMGAGGV